MGGGDNVDGQNSTDDDESGSELEEESLDDASHINNGDSEMSFLGDPDEDNFIDNEHYKDISKSKIFRTIQKNHWTKKQW